MRIRFFANTNEYETQRYLDLTRKAEAFWSEFSKQARGRAFSTTGLLELLHKLDRGLVLEVSGAGTANQARTCIVRASEPELSPLAEFLIERAPRLANWEFAASRGAIPLERAVALVQKRFSLDLSQMAARVGVARGHLLDVVLRCHEFATAGDERNQQAVEEFLALMLGDEIFDRWIGSVSTLPAPRPNSLRVLRAEAAESEANFLELKQLPLLFKAAINGVRSGLSETPYHQFCERAEWTMLDLEESEGNDLGMPQGDLVLCSTMLPEALKCFLQGSLFHSSRFSAHGETFAYLKYTSRHEEAEDRLNERTELEDVLNRALVPARVGCVVGGGLGTDYGYIDVALTSLDVGLEIVRRVAARAKVERESWILFCDSAWRNEWIGVHKDSPVPKFGAGPSADTVSGGS